MHVVRLGKYFGNKFHTQIQNSIFAINGKWANALACNDARWPGSFSIVHRICRHRAIICAHIDAMGENQATKIKIELRNKPRIRYTDTQTFEIESFQLTKKQKRHRKTTIHYYVTFSAWSSVFVPSFSISVCVSSLVSFLSFERARAPAPHHLKSSKCTYKIHNAK